MAQWLMNPTKNRAVAGSVPGLAHWVKGSGIAVRCGVGCRHGLDPTLLWLWRRPVATALIGPPNLGTSMCRKCSPRKGKKTKQTNKQTKKPLMVMLRGNTEDQILSGSKLDEYLFIKSLGSEN